MLDVKARPLLVYWEVTRACELSCRHCRAEAVPDRHPDELTTNEGILLLDRLQEFGPPLPHIVVTGGDPLKRPDLWTLIAEARARGFTVAITPSGTYALSPSIVKRFKDAGIWMMALSLDGSDAEKHDGIRQVPGSYDQTVRAAGWALDAEIPFQVNSLVCEQTAGDLPALYERVASLKAACWSLFFLVQVGRGRGLEEVSPQKSEQILTWIYERSAEKRVEIRTTEAPHYRRVAIGACEGDVGKVPPTIRRGFGIRDGCGVMFISHVGDVYPAGFLPVAAGNVRQGDPVEIYRDSEVFKSLRDPDLLKGRCGACEYRSACGGSRARAFAYTGDALEADPLCPYEPTRTQSEQVAAAL